MKKVIEKNGRLMLEIDGKMCKLERFQPYVDLFRWLKGEKNVSLEAYIDVVKRTKKNIRDSI